MTIGRCVGLQSLKNLLAVLQNACALAQYDIRIVRESALLPGAILIIRYITLIRLMISEADIFPI